MDVEGRECRSLFDAWEGEKVSVEQVSLDQLQTEAVTGSEGWVLRYDNGLWVKVKTVANRLNAEYAAVKANCDRLFGSVEGLDRKTQAQLLTGNAYSGIVFGMLDGKDVSERIWRLIKPEASQRGEW